jgi:predicted RNA binding protein YcfA (HicA-like mRNA interferase family)
MHDILCIELALTPNSAHDLSCMGNARKARAKILDQKRTKNVTLADVETVLREAGFLFDGGKGSHRVYRRPDGRKQVLAAHGKEIPSYIVRQVRALLD